MSLQVMSVVPLEKGKARIRFDDGTEVVLYKGEILKAWDRGGLCCHRGCL